MRGLICCPITKPMKKPMKPWKIYTKITSDVGVIRVMIPFAW